MRITLKCYATLARLAPPGEDLAAEPGETVAGLMERLGIERGGVRIILVNGRHAEPDTPLHDGDRVGLFPAVGGG